MDESEGREIKGVDILLLASRTESPITLLFDRFPVHGRKAIQDTYASGGNRSSRTGTRKVLTRDTSLTPSFGGTYFPPGRLGGPGQTSFADRTGPLERDVHGWKGGQGPKRKRKLLVKIISGQRTKRRLWVSSPPYTCVSGHFLDQSREGRGRGPQTYEGGSQI